MELTPTARIDLPSFPFGEGPAVLRLRSNARRSWPRIGLSVLVVLAMLIGVSADAQQPRRSTRQPQPPEPPVEFQPPPRKADEAPTAPVEQAESIQVDVSTRSVAITSSFTGVETLLFGAIDHSRQPSAESGYYDVVVILEGTPTELVARRKGNVAGIWVNTQSATFVSVPSYYAIATTRPLEEVASPNVLSENDIGFRHVRMNPIEGWESGLTTADLEDFKAAVIRLKKRDRLYVQEDYGVAFIGPSLFRATIGLPANVPIGQLAARVYLFREGRLLSSTATKVQLERTGLEQVVYSFAAGRPVMYGILTVSVAVFAGLAASALLRRARQ